VEECAAGVLRLVGRSLWAACRSLGARPSQPKMLFWWSRLGEVMPKTQEGPRWQAVGLRNMFNIVRFGMLCKPVRNMPKITTQNVRTI